jgi:hypothetical protein
MFTFFTRSAVALAGGCGGVTVVVFGGGDAAGNSTYFYEPYFF